MKSFYVYHVVTERPMKLGQIIKFDNNIHSGVYERVNEKKKIVEEIYNNPEKFKQEQLEHHTKVALRELAMEEVRKEFFPNYPSRLSSLYVSKNINDAIFWKNTFIKLNRKVYQLVKLKVNGREFTGNAYNCFEGTTSKEENVKLSIKYWQNESFEDTQPPINETLVDGYIEVVEILEEYQDKSII